MAIATSPYQNNNYQAASTYRPYQLPVNDIFKALTAQNEFWEIGARRVKSAYEGALDLKLSLEGNRELRDNFMKDAEKQMSELSSQDLSDPSIQRKGINIFRPLLRDEGILSDDQATRHIEKVNSDALQFRNKENGKYYSDTNHRYALMGAEEFKNSKDRMAGKNYLANRKEFEPFYDPTAELNGILKMCKPDKASGEAVKGMYIKSYSSESLSAQKINSCLDGGLSDKAKRQIQINAALTYKNNPEALRDKYIPHLQGTRTALSEQRAAIEGVLANKDHLKNLKKEQLNKLGFNNADEITPDALQRLQETSVTLDQRISNLNSTVSKLQDGDLSPITGRDFEAVASTVYSRDYMNNVAEGFSYDFNTNSVKADPVQMMTYKEQQINARQEDDQSFDRSMKEMEFEQDLIKKQMEMSAKKKTDKEANGDIDFTGMTQEEMTAARSMNNSDHPLSGVGKTDDYDNLTGKRQEIAKKRSGLNQEIDMQIGNPHPFGSPESRAFRNAYLESGQADPVKKKVIEDYHTKMSNYVAAEDLYKGIQDNVDERVAPMARNFQAAKQQLAAKGVLDIELKDSRGKKIRLNKNLGEIADDVLTGKAEIRRNGFGGTLTLDYGAYKKDIPNDASNRRDLLIQVFDFVKDNKNNDSKIRTARNKLIQEETVIQREGYTFPQLNNEKGLSGRLAQASGLSKENFSKITVGQTDLNGNVVVTVSPPGKSDNYEVKDVVDKLLTYGGSRTNSIVKGTENQVVLTGVKSLDLIDETNITHLIAPYTRSLESRAKPNKAATSACIRSGNGREYKMVVLPKHDGGFSYQIVDQAKPTSPVDILGDRETATRRFEQLLQRNQPSVSTR